MKGGRWVKKRCTVELKNEKLMKNRKENMSNFQQSLHRFVRENIVQLLKRRTRVKYMWAAHLTPTVWIRRKLEQFSQNVPAHYFLCFSQ